MSKEGTKRRKAIIGTIRMKAKQIINDEPFIASDEWCTHFMQHNKLVL